MSLCEYILVVEDDPDILDSLKDVLETCGYPVRIATNGKEALDCLHQMSRPCLILLDLMMPVMDGHQFLEVKKHDVAIVPIPVIVVSAIADQTNAANAEGFIKKPVDLDRLLEVVTQYCGHAEPSVNSTI